MAKVFIGNRAIGDGERAFIIAEAGVNHDNDVEKGKELIKAAADAGADAIKFQTYTADTLTTKNAPRYWNPVLDTDSGKTQHDYFKVLNDLKKEDYLELMRYAEECGIILFSTPFYVEAIDLLEEIGVPAYKIASADLTFHQMVRRIAKTGKPIIMSVGASSIDEVREAIEVITSEGNNKIILLHCILSYPCEDEDANLNKILALKKLFPQYPIGYSDHTRGLVPPIAAMALGAAVIEKHYTLDRASSAPSADHRFAVNPKELKEMVDASKIIHKALGKFSEEHYPAEEKAYELARRAVVADKDIKAGEIIEEKMLACKRAGKGLVPKHLGYFVGKKAKRDIPADTILNFEMVN